MNALVTVVLLIQSKDPVPDPNDVKAGWLGFGVFLVLVLAVVLLLFSFVRHLRKVRDNAEADPSVPERRPGTSAR